MALKVGAEDKTKVAMAAILGLAVVIVLLWQLGVFQMTGGSSTPAPLPQAAVQTPAATGGQPGTQAETQVGATHEATRVPSSIVNLDPTLHPEWMAAAESLNYAGKGRNIFSMESAPVVIPQPSASARPTPEQIAAALAPPPPPPIDLKFFGYEAHTGGDRKAFLLHGEDVFIASVGDVVDHRYKVVDIAPTSIQVEDIPYNNTQSLQLVQN